MNQASYTYVGAINTIRRDPSLVFRAVRSILQQTPAPEKVYLIDQNKQPLELPTDLKNENKLQQIHVNAPSPSAARNCVPKGIQQDWIVFCDDDGYLAPDYMNEFTKLLNVNPKLELIAGPYVNDATQEYYSIRFQWGGDLSSILGSKLLIGGNFAIRPNTYDRIGRYDERFGTGGFWSSSEETDLCWAAVASKVPMTYSPKIRVFHPPAHAPETWEAIKKSYRYGRGKGALAAKWMFERPHLLGYWEFVEMTIIPFINAARGCLRGEFRQILIQGATFIGRYKGFFEFLIYRGHR